MGPVKEFMTSSDIELRCCLCKKPTSLLVDKNFDFIGSIVCPTCIRESCVTKREVVQVGLSILSKFIESMSEL